MKKNKLLLALLMCSFIVTSVNASERISVGEAETVNVLESISGQSGLNGGAIDNPKGGSVVIGDGLTFEKNSSTNQFYGGGAIYSHNGGSINIGNNVTFKDNYIQQPDVDMNNFRSYSAGGAIASWGSGTVTVGDNAVFEHNGYRSDGETPASVEGGAMYITTDWTKQGVLTVGDNAQFKNNSGAEGGALYLECTNTTIGSSTFSENKSRYTDGGGGAIYAYGTNTVESNITLGSSNFNKNTAEGIGGAICNLLKSEMSIGENSKFESNSAVGHGGAIFNDSTLMDIKGGTAFVKNTSSANGGAIYNDNYWVENSKVVIGNGSTFSENKAVEGGAIYNNAQVEINGSTFTANSATQGGAIYNTANGVINMTDVTFNVATATAKNDIYNNGQIVTGGTNTFASDIVNNGSIVLGGTNTISGNISGSGSISSTGNLTWSSDNSNNLSASINVTGGTLNIGDDNGASGTLALVTGSSISKDTDVNIHAGSNLNISEIEVSLNEGDTWNGDVSLASGTLDVDGISNNGKIDASAGALKLNNSVLTVGAGSQISEAVKLTTGENVSLSILGSTDARTRGVDSTKGYIHIGNDDVISGAHIVLDGGQLDYAVTSPDVAATLDAKSGTLNLLEGSKLTFNGGTIANAVNLNIGKGSELVLASSSELLLDRADSWNGTIQNNGGVINADNLVKSSATAALIQEGEDASLNLYNNSNLALGTESKISNGNINVEKSVLTTTGNVITGGNMVVDEFSKFVVKNGEFKLNSLTASSDGVNTALVNTINGEYAVSSIGTLTVNNQANFNIDIHARSNQKTSNDQFVVGTLAGDGVARVDKWELNGDLYGWDAPIDRHITLKNVFVDEAGKALEGNIEVTDSTTFTPIGWYQLNKNVGAAGMSYTLDLAKFNPQVYRGQVATVAQWMNQLNISDMLFTHSMVLPSFKEADGGTMANRYAAESPLFAPYQYSRKDGGLWYKAYGTFENLQMNQGLSRVGNNAYGVLIGADLGLKELNNGWKFMPTAYLGYNGAHQTFAHVGQYQNGGQLGFLGTWYKDNLILGAMAYGGVYGNSMSVHGFNDETFNYFGGSALKASYNVRLNKTWVLQPNLFASYNYFGQQNWHTNFGQMGMMAGDLNGVNIAPGLNLIWEKETFSAYATLQYMYNLNGACGGRAGNVSLPHIEMDRGYIQYGLGVNKKFTDRASGYLQAVLRNAGRTGVGFQAGFNFMIGK